MKTRVKLGGYEAWLAIEGAEVEHYGIEVNAETNVATCWVASSAGKHFQLWSRKDHTAFTCSTHVILDGVQGGGTFLAKDSTGPVVKDSTPSSATTVRPFKFDSIQLSDDDSLLCNTSSYNAIGEIKIVIRRVSNIGEAKPAAFSSEVQPGTLKVHERAKKAVPHRVQYGNTVARATTVRSATFHEIVATFIFRYNSLDMLKANGIAHEANHSSLSNEPSGSTLGKRKAASVKPEEESEEEAEADEEELRKVAQLEAELQRARERLARPKKKVKAEPKPIKLRFIPGEVIDLTI